MGKGMGRREEATSFYLFQSSGPLVPGSLFFSQSFYYFLFPSAITSQTALRQSDQLYFKLRSVRSGFLFFQFFFFILPPPLHYKQRTALKLSEPIVRASTVTRRFGTPSALGPAIRTSQLEPLHEIMNESHFWRGHGLGRLDRHQ